MRRVVGALLAAIALALLAVPAHAQEDRPVVRVIQIGGLLDRVQADFWTDEIAKAEAEDAVALIVQIDSDRSVLPARDMGKLVLAIGRSDVPVAMWVGPARAGHVGGEVVRLLLVADVLGRAPGASIASPDVAPLAKLDSPTLGDFLVDLDGRAGIEIPTKVIGKGEDRRQEPQVTVRFAKPSLLARTVHGVTSPGPAYALFVFGLLLALLEFSTAGVGLAAATGAILLALGAVGLGGLPTEAPAVGALLFAIFGFGVDLQAGAPRFWTAIGTGSLLYGSLFLFGDGMDVPVIWILGVFGLTAAFVLAGLPSLIRARFSSPTIGREGFVGEEGQAIGELAPDGLVEVRGARWRARTNRATPIPDLSPVRVIGIDGLVLDVEPLEGAAKDYRKH